MNEEILKEETKTKEKAFKPPVSTKAAWIILAVLIFIAACSWGYSYATNVDVYAGSSTSYTQWIIMRPIAGGGCIGEDAPYASLNAIDRAIDYEYIVKLPVKLIDGKVQVAAEAPYDLSTALEKVAGQTGVILDIVAEKGNGEELSEKIYSIIKEYKGNLAVQSSSLDALKWFKDNADNVIRGLSTGNLEGEDLSDFEKLLHRNMLLNFKVLPYYIACDYDCLPNAIISDVNKDAYVIAQNISDTESAKAATEYSDNICIEGFSLY